MGKIRVKTLGDEGQEIEQKKKAQKRQVAKKTAKPEVDVEIKEPKAKKQKTTEKRTRSKQYQTITKLIEKHKTYSLSDALALLANLKRGTFDETVELHINTKEALSGSFTLPHGTGKQTKVAIADDKLVLEIEKGNIAFDVLLATPQMMPKLAKVARFLGPRGLMPNPKNGTITDKPTDAAKKFQSGLIHYKTEAKNPIIHLSVGKLSYGGKKLEDNIKTVLGNVNASKIKNITLKSTMSPGIKIEFANLS